MKKHNIDHDQDHTSWNKIFDGEAVWRPGTRITPSGALVCTAPGCGKLVTEAEVTCQFCIDGVAHRKPDGKSTGRPGPGCLRARCPGHERPRHLVLEEECPDDMDVLDPVQENMRPSFFQCFSSTGARRRGIPA